MTTVKLNVGGTIFETTIDTLMKCPYFQGMKHFEEILNNVNNIHFIDRDPSAFKHVLRLLRDLNYDYPQKYLNELDFYGIEYETNEGTIGTTFRTTRIPDKIINCVFGHSGKIQNFNNAMLLSIVMFNQNSTYGHYASNIIFEIEYDNQSYKCFKLKLNNNNPSPSMSHLIDDINQFPINSIKIIYSTAYIKRLELEMLT